MSTEELEMILDDTESQMQKAIAHLEVELTRIGQAKPIPAWLMALRLTTMGLLHP